MDPWSFIDRQQSVSVGARRSAMCWARWIDTVAAASATMTTGHRGEPFRVEDVRPVEKWFEKMRKAAFVVIICLKNEATLILYKLKMWINSTKSNSSKWFITSKFSKKWKTKTITQHLLTDFSHHPFKKDVRPRRKPCRRWPKRWRWVRELGTANLWRRPWWDRMILGFFWPKKIGKEAVDVKNTLKTKVAAAVGLFWSFVFFLDDMIIKKQIETSFWICKTVIHFWHGRESESEKLFLGSPIRHLWAEAKKSFVAMPHFSAVDHRSTTSLVTLLVIWLTCPQDKPSFVGMMFFQVS